MKRKPGWVSQWIWDDWKTAVELDASGERLLGLEDSESVKAAFEELLKDKNCACVWPAVERRTKDRGIAATGETTNRLCRAILCAFGPPTFHDTLPRKDRKAIASRIALHADKLAAELKNLSVGSSCLYGLPPMMLDSLYASAGDIVGPVFRRYAERTRDAGGTINVSRLDHMFLGGSLVVDQLNVLLASLSKSARTWGETRPIMTKGTKHERRLYFIRKMTEQFREWFGDPLREPVAALTNCIFECNLDAGSVANYAP